MKKHIASIIILFTLVFISWYKILDQVLIGEGGYYNYIHRFFSGHDGFPLSLFRYDAGARFIYDIVRIFFGDNVQPFQYIMLFGVALLGICFYFLVFTLTQKKNVALIAAIFFSINFTTLFEMIAIGNFQFFAQRVAQLIPEFISFIFFIKSIKTNNIFFGLLSLIFLAFGVLFAQYGIFFVPFYCTYFFSVLVIDGFQKSKTIFAFLLMVLCIIVSFIVLWSGIVYGGGSYVQSVNPLEFIKLNYLFFPAQIMRQLTILTVPDSIIRFIIKFFSRSYDNGIIFFYLPVVFLYLSSTFYLWKKEHTFRTILLASLLFIPIIFVSNILMRGDEVEKIHTSSRYLHIASVSTSLYWAIFFYSLMKRKLTMRIFFILCLSWWIYSNIQSIWKEIDKDYYQHVAVKTSIQHIKRLGPTFSDDSIIIVPSQLGYYGGYFVQIFYGKKNSFVAPYFSNWANELPRPFDLKKDFIFVYDIEKEIILDKTNEYKSIIAEHMKEE